MFNLNSKFCRYYEDKEEAHCFSCEMKLYVEYFLWCHEENQQGYSVDEEINLEQFLTVAFKDQSEFEYGREADADEFLMLMEKLLMVSNRIYTNND